MRLYPFALLTLCVLPCCTHAAKYPVIDPIPIPSPSTPPHTKPTPTIDISAYLHQIAVARLTSAQILKSASAAYTAHKLTDNQVGSIRSAGRRIDLEITIAESTLDLYRSGSFSRSRVDRAISDMNKSLSSMLALWKKYL